jgi:DNA-binding HxlR family transcriptional regulator
MLQMMGAGVITVPVNAIVFNYLPQTIIRTAERTHHCKASGSDLEVAENVQRPNTTYVEQVSRVIKLLQGKWTVQILCTMRERPKRLSELQRAIPSASKKALTASLRSLEAAQIVLGRDLSSSVLRVEYEIADTMREPLAVLLDQLAEWGRSYSPNGVPRDSAKAVPVAVLSPSE